jgi:hypothetical protein
MPEPFVQLVGQRFYGLQGRAADEVNDYQYATDIPKHGVLCQDRILHGCERSFRIPFDKGSLLSSSLLRLEST